MGQQKQNNQRCMLSATQQAISITLATTAGHFLRDLDLDSANVYMACLSWFSLGRGKDTCATSGAAVLIR